MNINVTHSERGIKKYKEMNCKYCKSETDKQTIFGVLERSHYDNRVYSGNHDTGPTTYKAIALVKIFYCDQCAQSFRNTSIQKMFLYGLLCLIGCPIFWFIAKSTGDWVFFLCFGGCALGAISLILGSCISFLRKPNYEAEFLEKYCENGTIDAEDIIAPVTFTPIKITPMNGDLSNRWDVKYSQVYSKKLKKISIEDMERGSRISESIDSERKAMVVLKRWYDEINKNILT